MIDAKQFATLRLTLHLNLLVGLDKSLSDKKVCYEYLH